MNITFDEFNEFWAGEFGSKLTERNGLPEWREFVEGQYISVRGLKETVREFSAEYNRALDEGRPVNNLLPSLSRVRGRYKATLKERQRKWAEHSSGVTASGGSCVFCGGVGRVWAMDPAKDDGARKLAPEDFRNISADRVYWGVEFYPCPNCRSDAYSKSPIVAERLREHSLPETVPAGHRDNPFGYSCHGGRLILDMLRRRLETGDAVQRRSTGSVSDDLSRLFPAPGEKMAGVV